MSGNVFSESATGQDLHQVKQNNEGSGILEGPKVRTGDLWSSCLQCIIILPVYYIDAFLSLEAKALETSMLVTQCSGSSLPC